MTRRVLVLSPRFPLPLQSGTQIRTYYALQALNDRFDVTLVSLVQDGEGADRVAELEADGITVRTVPHSRSRVETLGRFAVSGRPYRTAKFATPAFREAVADALAETDYAFAWVNFLQTVAVLPEDPGLALVVDEHNGDVRYWESFRGGGLATSLFARENIRRIRRFRDRVAARLDVVLSASDADATDAREWAGDAAVSVVPNGVDPERFTPSTHVDEAPERVLCVGSLDVTMNTDALEWFCREAWPTIRTQRPDARFDIVGRNPSEAVRELATAPGVELHANVPDVVPYYDEAAVVVAPFRFGGGTKLKLLEALAMERPVVTTPTGAVGIDVEDGVHVRIESRDPGFAETVSALLAEPARRRELGAAGRAFVTGRFEWDAVTSAGVEFVVDHLFETASP
jgi:glycosyltransferase involved in cell wall biosynthesis